MKYDLRGVARFFRRVFLVIGSWFRMSGLSQGPPSPGEALPVKRRL